MTPNRLKSDGPPGRRLRCTCGGDSFLYADSNFKGQFGLHALTSDGPIHQDLPDMTHPELKSHVACVACKKEYGPDSRWDPAN